MKKTFKVLGAFLMLVSLAACQDLGSEIKADEAQKRQAELQTVTVEKAPKVYSISVSTNMSYDLGETLGGAAKGTMTMRGEYNLDKLYAHYSTKYSATSKTTKEEQAEESWIYYQQGYLYAISKGETKNTGFKMQLTEAQAKVSIFDQVNDLFTGDGEGSLMDSLTGGSTLSMITKGINVNSETKYYSKGEGNLSVVTTGKAAVKQGETSVSLSMKTSMTYDAYLPAAASVSINFSSKSGKESYYLKGSASLKSGRSCSIKYPTVADADIQTRTAEQ